MNMFLNVNYFIKIVIYAILTAVRQNKVLFPTIFTLPQLNVPFKVYICVYIHCKTTNYNN